MQQRPPIGSDQTSAPMVQALASGKWYREPKVIQQVESLLCCGRGEFWRRVQIAEYTQEGFVSEEALVYFIREYHRSGAGSEAGDLMEILEERCRKSVARKLRRWSYLSETQRDDCYHDILSHMFTALLSGETGDEFWEVRFWYCLDCKISNFAQKYHHVAQNEFVPDSGESEDGRPLDYMGNIAAPTRTTSEERALIAEALRLLSVDQRKVFVLFHYEQWTQDEIAKYLNVTDRTVRNRLESAEKRLKSWRADEPLREGDRG